MTAPLVRETPEERTARRIREARTSFRLVRAQRRNVDPAELPAAELFSPELEVFGPRRAAPRAVSRSLAVEAPADATSVDVEPLARLEGRSVSEPIPSRGEIARSLLTPTQRRIAEFEHNTVPGRVLSGAANVISRPIARVIEEINRAAGQRISGKVGEALTGSAEAAEGVRESRELGRRATPRGSAGAELGLGLAEIAGEFATARALPGIGRFFEHRAASPTAKVARRLAERSALDASQFGLLEGFVTLGAGEGVEAASEAATGGAVAGAVLGPLFEGAGIALGRAARPRRVRGTERPLAQLAATERRLKERQPTRIRPDVGVQGETAITQESVLRLSAEEIERAATQQTAFEKNIEATLFGEQGAKRYAQAQRTANSSMASRERLEAADKVIAEMEATLTEPEQNALFGIGKAKELNAEELREVSRVARDYLTEEVRDFTEGQLGNTLAREVLTGKPTKDAVSAIRLRGTIAELRRRGVDDTGFQRLISDYAERNQISEADAFDLFEGFQRDLQRRLRPSERVEPGHEGRLLASPEEARSEVADITPPVEPERIVSKRVVDEMRVDDFTAKRLGFSEKQQSDLNRILNDVDLVAQERQHVEAVTTAGSRVVSTFRKPSGELSFEGEGTVVRSQEVKGRQVVLVEHDFQGAKVQRFHDVTDLGSVGSEARGIRQPESEPHQLLSRKDFDSFVSEAELIIRSDEGFNDFGYRYVEDNPSLGSRLERSHERGESGESLGELRGTSTFRDASDLRKFIEFNKDGNIVLVKGERTGTGSLDGEVIIDDAVVVLKRPLQSESPGGGVPREISEVTPASIVAETPEMSPRVRQPSPAQVEARVEGKAGMVPPNEAEIPRTIPARAGDTLPSTTLYSPANRKGLLGDRVRRVAARIVGKTPAIPTTDVRDLATIARNLAKVLDVPLAQGRFLAGLRRAAGVFNVQPETIRVLRFDRLDTVAHEVGHYISKKYLVNPTKAGARARGAPKLTPEALGEIRTMGKNLYGDRKPAGGYGEEGIAEWVSFFVVEPERIKTEAPNFSRFMDEILAREPALRDALTQARGDFERYSAAPPNQRIASMISVNEKVRNVPTIRSLMTNWFDDLFEFKRAVGELAGDSPPTRNAYNLARLSRGSAGAAEEMLDRGVVRFGTTERVGPSVRAAIKSIPPERIQAFREYLVSESALERIENGIDPGISKADAVAVAEAGRSEFSKAAESLWAHGRALIEYRRDAGLLTADEAKTILLKNKRRVAFYRVFGVEELPAGGRGGTSGGFGMSGSGVKRQTGSARQIIDPLESVMKDTYTTIAQARQHQVLTTLVRMAEETEGGGRIVERVPTPKREVGIPLDRVKSQLEDLGFTRSEVLTEADRISPTGELKAPREVLADETAVLRSFEDAHVPGPSEAKDLVIPLLEGGKREWFAIRDRKLYDAVEGLNTPEMGSLMRWISFPARTLRVGATATLEFLGSNPLRDAWASSVFSRANFRFPGVGMAEGFFHYLKADGVFQRWKLAGGDNVSMLGLDRPQVRRGLRSLVQMSKQDRLLSVVRHPIDHLRMLGSIAENSNRIGEFAAIERQAVARGTPPGDVQIEAGIGSRDVSLDFFQMGIKARAVNSIVAFFNANVRGTAQLVREIKARPKTILSRAGATITAPSVALYLMQRNDPAYQETPRWVKDVAWVYVQRGTDQGEGWDGHGTGKVEHIFTIPKPFELGVLFGTVPERILEWIDTQDPAAIESMVTSLQNTFTPPYIPTAIVGPIENFGNRSTFFDRPIVPRGREDLEPAEQTSGRTGETARLVGRALDASPAKIQNLTRSYTGGLGGYVTSLSDAAIREGRELLDLPPLRPAREDTRPLLARIPGIKRFVRGPSGRGAESVNRLFNDFNDAESKRRTWQAMKTEGRTEEAAQFFEENEAAIISVATSEQIRGGGPLRRSMARMRELQAALRSAENAGDRSQIDRITQRMLSLARSRRQHPEGN